VPYTFTVTNAGNVTLSGITVNDPKCNVAPAYQSGDTNTDSKLQLSETWIYTCSHTVSQAEIDAGGNLSNTVTADSTESGSDTDTKNIPINQPSLFDPPSGFKTVTSAGYPELVWRMVWINNSNVVATAVRITDTIPANTTYIGGSLACTPQGSSSTQTCTYDSGNNRVIWQGTIAPDSGAQNETQAQNEVIITFKTSMNTTVTRVQNQGCANWDANGDGSVNDEITAGQTPVCSDNPATQAVIGDPTVWTKATTPVAVPTMNEWGMIILLVLQGMGALYYMRRRAKS
jgi:hypothetical protein